MHSKIRRSIKKFPNAKQPTGLRRKAASKKPSKRILIVCEGEKSEPIYLRWLKNIENKMNIEIDIAGEDCDSAPIKVVNYAEARANREGRPENGGYSEVYCVIDRDEHADFDRARDRVRQLNSAKSKFAAKSIHLIVSYPCFETWILFHFIYSRAPIGRSGRYSPGDMATQKLRREILEFAEYSKSPTKKELACLTERTELAISNSIRAMDDAEKTGEHNPSTEMHKLVNKIKSGFSDD